MPVADLLTIAESLRSAADALDAADARAKAAAELLRRCRDYLGDGHATAPIARGLVADIETVLSN